MRVVVKGSIPLLLLLLAALIPGCGKTVRPLIVPANLPGAQPVASAPAAEAPEAVAAVDPTPTEAASTTTAAAAPSDASLRQGLFQPNAYALVVGIQNYRDVPEVPGASADAKRFAELAKTTLGIPDKNLRVLTDDRATKVDIEKSLRWISMNVPKGGTVYVYFSGHGSPHPSDKTAYFVPYDGDPAFLKDTAIGVDAMLAKLDASPATQVIAFVDSCFSGAGGRSVLPKGARPLATIKQAPAPAHVVMFSAASGAQIAGPKPGGGGGVFSHFLVEGLGTGAADIDGDGRVTAEELSSWVTPRVEREAKRDGREQKPVMVKGSGGDSVVITGGYR